jgi:hypothetical protein
LPLQAIVEDELLRLLALGPLSTQDAYRLLAEQMSITAAQRAAVIETANGQENGWANLVRFARRRLVDDGYLFEPSRAGHGLWRLTDAGLARAELRRKVRDGTITLDELGL